MGRGREEGERGRGRDSGEREGRGGEGGTAESRIVDDIICNINTLKEQ